jgi:hypothetical protein
VDNNQARPLHTALASTPSQNSETDISKIVVPSCSWRDMRRFFGPGDDNHLAISRSKARDLRAVGIPHAVPSPRIRARQCEQAHPEGTVLATGLPLAVRLAIEIPDNTAKNARSVFGQCVGLCAALYLLFTSSHRTPAITYEDAGGMPGMYGGTARLRQVHCDVRRVAR